MDPQNSDCFEGSGYLGWVYIIYIPYMEHKQRIFSAKDFN